jgi:hypothetical protein
MANLPRAKTASLLCALLQKSLPVFYPTVCLALIMLTTLHLPRTLPRNQFKFKNM